MSGDALIESCFQPGGLIADLAWYWSGKRYGRRVLGLLCKMSLSPDFCVRQTETVFSKVGPWSLLFAKFFPGLSTISVAMAGVTRMSLPTFVLLNAIGALLFMSVAVAMGRVFQAGLRMSQRLGLLSTNTHTSSVSSEMGGLQLVVANVGWNRADH